MEKEDLLRRLDWDSIGTLIITFLIVNLTNCSVSGKTKTMIILNPVVM